MFLDLSPLAVVGIVAVGAVGLFLAAIICHGGRANELAAAPQEDFFAPIAETYPETAGELEIGLSDTDVDNRFAAIVAAETARGIYPNRRPYTRKVRDSKEDRDV